jgi:hypothetical protein
MRLSSVFDELSVKIICSFIHPVIAGVKVTDSGTVCPGPIDTGRFIPVTLNSAPLTLTAETVTLACPVLVTSTTWLSELPTATLPNLTFDDDDTSVCCCRACEGTAKAARRMMAVTMGKKEG